MEALALAAAAPPAASTLIRATGAGALLSRPQIVTSGHLAIEASRADERGGALGLGGGGVKRGEARGCKGLNWQLAIGSLGADRECLMAFGGLPALPPSHSRVGGGWPGWEGRMRGTQPSQPQTRGLQGLQGLQGLAG